MEICIYIYVCTIIMYISWIYRNIFHHNFTYISFQKMIVTIFNNKSMIYIRINVDNKRRNSLLNYLWKLHKKSMY